MRFAGKSVKTKWINHVLLFRYSLQTVSTVATNATTKIQDGTICIVYNAVRPKYNNLFGYTNVDFFLQLQKFNRRANIIHNYSTTYGFALTFIAVQTSKVIAMHTGYYLKEIQQQDTKTISESKMLLKTRCLLLLTFKAIS